MSKLIEKYKPLFFELVRFGIVGVISFVFDWGFLRLTLFLGFDNVKTTASIMVSTAVGFTVGVTVNYLLSVLFVFKAAKNGAGKDVKSAVIFLIASAIGGVITELIMHFGTITLGYNEDATKVVATLIVMMWNYISRKLLIFK